MRPPQALPNRLEDIPLTLVGRQHEAFPDDQTDLLSLDVSILPVQHAGHQKRQILIALDLGPLGNVDDVLQQRRR